MGEQGRHSAHRDIHEGRRVRLEHARERQVVEAHFQGEGQLSLRLSVPPDDEGNDRGEVDRCAVPRVS